MESVYLHCGSHIIPHPEDGPVDATQPPLSMCVGKPYIMGQTAEFIAQHMDISRKEMDEVALKSQNNAERANEWQRNCYENNVARVHGTCLSKSSAAVDDSVTGNVGTSPK